MFLLTMPIDSDEAVSRMREIMGMAATPERLALKINAADDLPRVNEGLKASSFDALVKNVERLKKFIAIEKEIDSVKHGKWAFSFLGKGMAEKKIKSLMAERRGIGSLIDAPRWYYGHPRVWLLNCFRDYVLTMSQKGESRWIDQKDTTFHMPILEMFENGDVSKAKAVAKMLEQPLEKVDPVFILTELEGNSVVNFDLSNAVATYYVPVRENH